MARNFGHEDAGLATPETLSAIVENFAIRTFLESSGKRYLVGPKGSGKTLVLLRKAIDERRRGDALCIPSDPDLPVDRLTAASHVGKKFNYKTQERSESSLAWTAVWKHSILRSVVHHLRDEILREAALGGATPTGQPWYDELALRRMKEQKGTLELLLSNTTVHAQRPFQYYTELGARLDARPGQLARVRDELQLLESLLHLIRREVNVFLDNLDDYYERDPELWFNSMYGQFRAVRELSLAHRHIHLFTSIRQDVYVQFSDEMRLQYYDYVAQLRYDKTELLQIFAAAISRLDSDLLRYPQLQASDPWRSFFGDIAVVPNAWVGQDEQIGDYLYRHTLGRPRDMIHMGTVLLEYRPRSSFDIASVRKAVSHAERDIAEQYLAEVRALLDPRFDIKAFVAGLPSNVLTLEDIDAVHRRYANSNGDTFDQGAASDLARPFETLYDLGLLGSCDAGPDAAERIQHFRPPGHGLGDHAGRTMPESEHYFLHPVLNFLLRPQQRSRELIVGNGCAVPSSLRRSGPPRSGKAADRQQSRRSDLSGQRAEGPVRRRLAAILAADVVGYSRLMEQDETGTLAALRERHRTVFAPLVAQHEGRIVKVMGDGVLAEFSSAVNAVQCGLELQARMAAVNASLPEMQHVVWRIGINLGEVVVEGDDLFGDGVNVAARLQALVEPGGICISGKVRDEVDRKIGVAFDDMGEQVLKNMTSPVRLYRLRSWPSASSTTTGSRSGSSADASADDLDSGPDGPQTTPSQTAPIGNGRRRRNGEST
jgi:class 3 adenylate cyclase